MIKQIWDSTFLLSSDVISHTGPRTTLYEDLKEIHPILTGLFSSMEMGREIWKVLIYTAIHANPR